MSCCLQLLQSYTYIDYKQTWPDTYYDAITSPVPQLGILPVSNKTWGGMSISCSLQYPEKLYTDAFASTRGERFPRTYGRWPQIQCNRRTNQSLPPANHNTPPPSTPNYPPPPPTYTMLVLYLHNLAIGGKCLHPSLGTTRSRTK